MSAYTERFARWGTSIASPLQQSCVLSSLPLRLWRPCTSAQRTVVLDIFIPLQGRCELRCPRLEAVPNEQSVGVTTARRVLFQCREAPGIEEYVLVIPDGLSLRFGPATTNTRIDLPVKGNPSCTLQLRGPLLSCIRPYLPDF